MLIEKEKSCGVIPFRLEKDDLIFLLVRNIGGHWEFPKGHTEKGETERQTAKREFAEETGLKVKKLLRRKYPIHYYYTWEGKRRLKKVTYFLGHVQNGMVKIQEEEIIDFKWLPYQLALKKLSFKDIKNIFKDCRKELAEYLDR